MGVIIWLLIPIGAVVAAMAWTAMLARKERRRADEKWRAARLAERGGVLVSETSASPVAVPGSPAEEAIEATEATEAVADPPIAAGLAEGTGQTAKPDEEPAALPKDGHVES